MFARKTTPRVREGKVQKKNRWITTETDHYQFTSSLQIIQEQQTAGVEHVVNETDLQRFIRLIPEWNDLSEGLHSIVLSGREHPRDGLCRWSGIIELCAWPLPYIQPYDLDYCREHSALFTRLGVPSQQVNSDTCEVFWTRETARAYQLLHVFLHELGHHYDKMHSPQRRRGTRGEEFAEEFAYKLEASIWPKYKEYFGNPARNTLVPQRSENSSRMKTGS